MQRWLAVLCLAAPVCTAACPALLFLAPDINWKSRSDSTSGRTPSWPPGPRQLGRAVQYPASFVTLDAVVTADLNGDGRSDVAAIQPNGHSVLVFYQTTSGVLGEPVIVDAGDIMLRGIAAGDLNGDRRADLAVSGVAGMALSGYLGRLTILYQTPAGTLATPLVDTVASQNVGGMTVGDVNGDGRTDAVVMAEWVIGPTQGRLSIRYQQVDGSLGPETLYDHGSITYLGDIHIADMNHDGRNDILLQTGTDFSIIQQTATGALSDTLDLYTVPNTLGYRVFAIGVGDLNGDGWNDVLVPDASLTNKLDVWLQTSGGNLVLTPQDSLALGGPPNHLAVADIDGDGQNDVIGDETGQILVLYQGPDHHFPTVSSYGLPNITGVTGTGLAVGDATGDGWLDVIATAGTSGVYVVPSVMK